LEKNQNIEGMEKVKEQNRLRKQKQRTKTKELQAPAQDEFCGTNDITDVTSKVSHSMSRDSHAIEREEEIERDKEIDIEREREIEISLNDKSINICKYFENASNGKSIAQHIEEIKQLVTMYPNDWILEAIDISVKKKVYAISFIEKILKNWVSEGKKEKGAAKDGSTEQDTGASARYNFR
jgi:hypothetical protein